MTKPIKTNPQYAALAYRRTILHEVIMYLKRKYVGLDDDPKDQLICEEVLHVDRVIPPDEVDSYVSELEAEEEHLRLELNKYEFSRKNNEPKQKWDQKAQKGQPNRQ
jgi:hypothetical protein